MVGILLIVGYKFLKFIIVNAGEFLVGQAAVPEGKDHRCGARRLTIR